MPEFSAPPLPRACAANLNAQQMRWVLDYTAQQCSGIAAWQRDTQHMEKGFVYGGMPARGGVTSALLVQSGWTGVDDVFSGADNFLQAEALRASPESLADQPRQRYEVTQTDIKKWTVGAPIQAPLDALENLLKRPPIRRGSGAASDRAHRRVRRKGREQSRNARHLPAAHGRGDVARQNRFLPGGARHWRA